MKGKTGNLIRILRENEGIVVDGPATFRIKEIRRNKVIVLIDGNDETNIERESTEAVTNTKNVKD